MSVRWGMLALLAEKPMYGAQLRAEFEARTGGTWPVNIGQVYTTLDRLVRDELAVAEAETADGTIVHRITTAGEAEVARWWAEPVEREGPPRSEIAIKLALAVTAPGVDVAAVVQVQRVATVRHLQDLTRLSRDGEDADLAWSLVVQSLIFTAEAEVRWLDHVEVELTRRGSKGGTAVAEPTAEPTPLDRSRR